MTTLTFANEMRRLRTRFGERAFDEEFSKLVWREVSSMDDYDFVRLVDILIGTRAATRPPTVVDFREARLNADKRKFNEEVAAAAKGWDSTALPRTLEKFWPGCKTAMEAVEVEILKIKVARANGG